MISNDLITTPSILAIKRLFVYVSRYVTRKKYERVLDQQIQRSIFLRTCSEFVSLTRRKNEALERQLESLLGVSREFLL